MRVRRAVGDPETTGANVPDVNPMIPLIDAIPPVARQAGPATAASGQPLWGPGL